MIRTIPQLSLSEAFNASTSKIFQFRGRSRRSEFWWTQLMVYVVMIFLPPIGWLLDLATIPLIFRRLHDTGRSGWWYGICFILKVLFIVCLIYDIVMLGLNAEGLRGYEQDIAYTIILKYLIWFIAIGAYQVLLLIFMCIDSEQYENEYGESPKYVDED